MTGFDLRLWRKSQGWTQAQAALAMGCGERSWRRYEESGPPVMLERAIISMELKCHLAVSQRWIKNKFYSISMRRCMMFRHDVDNILNPPRFTTPVSCRGFFRIRKFSDGLQHSEHRWMLLENA